MPTLIFDISATNFGADDHPERPARLVLTRAHLIRKRPEWAWMQPRIASQEEILRVHQPKHLERLRQPFDFDSDIPFYPGSKNTPGALLEPQLNRLNWLFWVRKVFL